MDWPGFKPGFQGGQPRVLIIRRPAHLVFYFFESFKLKLYLYSCNRKSAGFIVSEIFYLGEGNQPKCLNKKLS